jgi:hypothetical protein
MRGGKTEKIMKETRLKDKQKSRNRNQENNLKQKLNCEMKNQQTFFL